MFMIYIANTITTLPLPLQDVSEQPHLLPTPRPHPDPVSPRKCHGCNDEYPGTPSTGRWGDTDSGGGSDTGQGEGAASTTVTTVNLTCAVHFKLTFN